VKIALSEISTPGAFWGLPVAEAAQRAAAAARSLMTQS
jgi:hypothetical protein